MSLTINQHSPSVTSAHASFDRVNHYRKIFANSSISKNLWIDLAKGDENRLQLARKEYNRCKDAMLIGENRSSRIGQIASFAEKAAFAAFFGYKLFEFWQSPDDFDKLCSMGLEVGIAALGMSQSPLGQISSFPNSLPKVVGQALSLFGLGTRATDISLDRCKSMSSQAQQQLRSVQVAHKEHLRLSAAEMDTLDQFAKLASKDESENHRALLEIFRSIKSPKK